MKYRSKAFLKRFQTSLQLITKITMCTYTCIYNRCHVFIMVYSVYMCWLPYSGLSEDIHRTLFLLFQVEAALQTDPNNEELLKLKDDLQEVIKLTRDLIKTQLEEQRKSSYVEPSSSKTASSNYFDEIEAALLEAEKLVTSAKVWKIGDKCQAKWTEDGQYYDATIEGITGKGEVSVIFDAYQNRSTTTINELRERTARNEVFPSNK